MNIVSFQFALFFLVVLPCNWLLRGRPGYRLFLLAASYVFYGAFGLKFLLILVEFSFFTWLFSLLMSRTARQGLRRLYLTLLLCIGLFGLAFYKYYDLIFFGMDRLLIGMGLHNPLPMLDIMLPVGISFFTFQGLSYAMDVYRDPEAVLPDIRDVLVFVAFFPTILSGPILRAPQLVPQLDKRPALAKDDCSAGVFLILSGLFKKLVLAGYLGAHGVAHVFDFPDAHSSLGVLAGVLAYTMQIYCDFSGYTDLVLGVGLLMGFSLPQNFDRPYASFSVREFWHRWHISFSTWLRDYLYFSLGGSRVAAWRKHLNLLLTMAIGGLWHGAGLNFIFWGVLHGAGLIANHLYRDTRKRRGLAPDTTTPLARAACWLGTFAFVSFAWIFFRANSFEQGWDVVLRMLTLDSEGDGPNVYVLAIVALVLLKDIANFDMKSAYVARLRRVPLLVHALLLGILGTLILRLGPDGVPMFIYFQF